MEHFADPIDRALLNDWQRDFPVATRPYGVLAQSLGTTEADVIARLRAKRAAGQITRVGATVTPNTLSASTLAAVAAPEARIDEVASIIGAEPGVNHSYLRENRWNLWFVATGPDRAHIDRALARIMERDDEFGALAHAFRDLLQELLAGGLGPAAPRADLVEAQIGGDPVEQARRVLHLHAVAVL